MRGMSFRQDASPVGHDPEDGEILRTAKNPYSVCGYFQPKAVGTASQGGVYPVQEDRASGAAATERLVEFRPERALELLPGVRILGFG